MAGRRQMSLEDRIKKAETVLIKAKEKYDVAAENLNRLVKKKKELESKELLQAYEKSDRSLEEVLAFLRGKDGSNDGDESD